MQTLSGPAGIQMSNFSIFVTMTEHYFKHHSSCKMAHKSFLCQILEAPSKRSLFSEHVTFIICVTNILWYVFIYIPYCNLSSNPDFHNLKLNPLKRFLEHLLCVRP